MRSALALVCVVWLAACSGGSSTSSTTTSVPATTTTEAPTTTSRASTTTTEVLELCDAPEFFPAVLPAAAVDETPAFEDVPFDQFTVVPGAWIGMRNDESGNPVMVLIRGALPPVQFTEEIEPITILDGAPAALGPLGDGYWAVAFALAPDDRCELYSLVLYPPTSADEARAVALSLTEGTALQP